MYKMRIWRNGIISNSFEPGSTGKVLTYAAAIEEGLITEDTQFDDSEGLFKHWTNNGKMP